MDAATVAWHAARHHGFLSPDAESPDSLEASLEASLDAPLACELMCSPIFCIALLKLSMWPFSSSKLSPSFVPRRSATALRMPSAMSGVILSLKSSRFFSAW